jgi:hypothetical protein
MNPSDYALEIAVRYRLAELRADAERWGRFEAGGSVPPRLRDLVRGAFIWVGSRVRQAAGDRLRRARA